jgi:2-isopropylmalate synthase
MTNPTPDAHSARVVIFDTTLRDGEQCPGATMTFEEKLEVADCLDSMGVDIIEAGFPIASDGDFEAVSEISKRVKRATIAGLARAINADIDRAGEAVRHARRGRIHTFVSTSPIHLAHQMRKSEADVLEIISATVARARNLVEDVEWSAMDATRTGIDYLCQCVDAAIKAGATTINLPDTVGYATPEEYAAMFRAVRERVANSDKGRVLDPLPQRPRARGRQLAGGSRCRRAADRMHDKRHRRAGRKRGARGDRDGGAHAR